jgi:hypothetical protein
MLKPSTASLKMSSSTSNHFPGGGDFLAKAFTYQRYFNLVRPNSTNKTSAPGDRRAAPTTLAIPALLASVCFLGLSLERLWGIRCP